MKSVVLDTYKDTLSCIKYDVLHVVSPRKAFFTFWTGNNWGKSQKYEPKKGWWDERSLTRPTIPDYVKVLLSPQFSRD